MRDLQVKQKNTLSPIAAELSPTLYYSHDILVAARNLARRKRAKIEVICGPIVLVDEHGCNGLVDLAGKGIVDLTVRHIRGSTFEFRVMETESGYVLLSKRPGGAHVREKGPRVQYWVELFDAWKGLLGKNLEGTGRIFQ